MRSRHRSWTVCWGLVFWSVCGSMSLGQALSEVSSVKQAQAQAQVPGNAPVVLPSIADTPTYIDPAELLSSVLTKPVTKDFDDVSLSEVAAWLQEQTGLNVVLDERSLDGAGVLPSEPVTDRLVDAPLYLLLDRLESIGVGWRLAGGVLYLQKSQEESAVQTIQYNIGDLLDQKMKSDELRESLIASVDRSAFLNADVDSAVVLLGDVLFVRQSPRTHRRVAGWLAALRKPARRVLVDDPAQHAPIRAALDRVTSVQFKGQSFSAAVQSLAEQQKIDIRWDRIALKQAKISERVPVTLDVREQSLRTILDIFTAQMGLSWILRDGALWITTKEEAEHAMKIAVFDVRDLCRNRDECASLQDTIEQQSSPSTWDTNGGTAVIAFPASGIMVVSQTEPRLDAVLALLENYRVALRNSKRRISPEEDPDGIETRYYRMPTEVANDLVTLLPKLVASDTWATPLTPTAAGTILVSRSWSQAPPTFGGNASKETAPLKESYSVLIITQTRRVHAEISVVLNKIQHGDVESKGIMGGMGGMGGGFGGGMM
jgi:predicted nicotinamide N-methyase